MIKKWIWSFNKMDNTKSYIDFLISVLLSDGAIKKEEMELLNRILPLLESDSNSLTEIKNKISGKSKIDLPNVIKYIAANFEKSLLLSLVKDSYAMAKADGEISKEEVTLINSLLKSANVSDDNFEQIRHWAEEYIYLLERGSFLFAT
jgi:uncharacterized tellurite resistance protein B-like protein